MKLKKIISHGIILGLCLYAGGSYFWHSPAGVKQQQALRCENARVQEEVALLEHENSELASAIETLTQDPVAQERIMREDLQMVHTNEYVYLLR